MHGQSIEMARDDVTVWANYTYARINESEKIMKDWFKYIRNRLRMTAFSAHAIHMIYQWSGSARCSTRIQT